MPAFTKRSHIEGSVREVFDWHARPGAFERLTPPWEHVEIEERRGGIEDGARLVMRLGRPPLRLRWVADHRDCIDGRQFCDVQTSGPFRRWEHLHRFEPVGDSACLLEDHIEYELPHPQVVLAFGFLTVKPRLFRSSWKSTTAPSR